MPKKVIVNTIWSCSLCELETDKDKIADYTITGNGTRLHYDICATCMASEPFATLLAAGMTDKMVGRAKVGAVDVEGKTKCLYCEKSYTENGMGMHMASAHGVKSKTQLLVEKRGKTGKLKCDECGFRTNAPQGLAAHQVARHGKAAIKPVVVGHPCPDCPDFVAENAQGLGAHRRHVHPGEPKLGHGGGHKRKAG